MEGGRSPPGHDAGTIRHSWRSFLQGTTNAAAPWTPESRDGQVGKEVTRGRYFSVIRFGGFAVDPARSLDAVLRLAGRAAEAETPGVPAAPSWRPIAGRSSKGGSVAPSDNGELAGGPGQDQVPPSPAPAGTSSGRPRPFGPASGDPAALTSTSGGRVPTRPMGGARPPWDRGWAIAVGGPPPEVETARGCNADPLGIGRPGSRPPPRNQ